MMRRSATALQWAEVFFCLERFLVLIELSPMTNLVDDDCFSMDAVVAGAKPIPSGEIARQGLGPAYFRPVCQAFPQAANAVFNRHGQPVELLGSLRGQFHGRHARRIASPKPQIKIIDFRKLVRAAGLGVVSQQRRKGGRGVWYWGC